MQVRLTTSVIEIEGLVKRYGEAIAVDGVNLSVYENEIFGILGPNGAGKTTTLEIVEGLREPDEGFIRIAGVDPIKNPNEVKRMIGVQLQTTALFDFLTVSELITLFAELYSADAGKDRIDELIELVSLQEKVSSRVNQLSGGQHQRLSIALALVNDPDILFLDEPTTGLDPQARRNLWQVIANLRDEGKTIVLTTHYMEEAEQLCDRVAVMDFGKVMACDSPLALIQSLDQNATIRARIDHEVDLATLDRLPGVLSSTITDHQLSVQTTDVQQTLNGLLTIADSLNFQLDNLTTSSANLEDVFLYYTGRSLRE